MDEKLESIFVNFADSHEESLNEMGLSRESFIEQARSWCETDEGKLEIQKFILEREILDLEDEISEIEDTINKKRESINEIEDELSKM
ncbi:MAG: hypothetical protein BZ138_00380 [Methanosphaera sp. rholeuAM270]|nr:MAG: hypothetical protein BZ138_00380 [Methanosphaera sp. rholeuAM270]